MTIEQPPLPPRPPLQAEPADRTTALGALMVILCLLPLPLVFILPWIGVPIGGGAFAVNMAVFKKTGLTAGMKIMLILAVDAAAVGLSILIVMAAFFVMPMQD